MQRQRAGETLRYGQPSAQWQSSRLLFHDANSLHVYRARLADIEQEFHKVEQQNEMYRRMLSSSNVPVKAPPALPTHLQSLFKAAPAPFKAPPCEPPTNAEVRSSTGGM